MHPTRGYPRLLVESLVIMFFLRNSKRCLPPLRNLGGGKTRKWGWDLALVTFFGLFSSRNPEPCAFQPCGALVVRMFCQLFGCCDPDEKEQENTGGFDLMAARQSEPTAAEKKAVREQSAEAAENRASAAKNRGIRNPKTKVGATESSNKTSEENEQMAVTSTAADSSDESSDGPVRHGPAGPRRAAQAAGREKRQ